METAPPQTLTAPQLLAPAGTLRNLRYALAYGADAVYAGQPRYSLRVRNNDFNKIENLATGIAETHAQGRAFYLTVNISPHNSKLKSFIRDLEPIIALGADALIMADPGLILMVREQWPEQRIHLSVQANTVNYATVRFWEQQGLTRIILSRELSIEEIAEIRQACPDMELEVFVHGALCIAYSGRCLLSGYFNHRDPNQGACTNACRWGYRTIEAAEDDSGDLRPAAPSSSSGQWLPNAAQLAPTDTESGDSRPQLAALLEESSRPGEQMPVFEDEHGTYIMNSKDLRAVQHVQRLVEIGVDCLKIEGRTKSHYYVARTAQVYRRAIDDAVAQRPFDMALMGDLDKLASRGYTEGFYRRHVPEAYQNYERGSSMGDRQQFVGEIVAQEGEWLDVEVKNRFQLGDRLELMRPEGNFSFVNRSMRSRHGESIEVAPGSGHRVQIHCPLPQPSDRALLLKEI